MIFVNFDQVWTEVDSRGSKNPNFDLTLEQVGISIIAKII